MAKQLQSSSVVAPGFFGLNTQESGVTLDAGYALVARNCVIDKFGRLGARKGWRQRTSSIDGVQGDNVGINLVGCHHFVDLGGTSTYLTWSNDTFYVSPIGEPDNLQTITPTTTDTITDGGWRVATLNDRAYFFNSQYKPLYYTNETTSSEFKSIDQHANYVGTVPQGSIVLSAYGRLWVAGVQDNLTTVYFSDLLDGVNWGSGSAGSLNIAGSFSKDSDTITGLAAHNGYLIVFCKNSTIIFADNDSFQGSFDVTTVRLVEVLEGVGCIATDSIQNTGEDVLFLSSTGVQSLARTIQEKSQPMRDVSKNIRDELVNTVEDVMDLDTIKSVYSPINAFYLLMFTEEDVAYCFDTRAPLQDGSLRVTEWTAHTHTNAMYDKLTRKLFFTQTDGLADYFGYTDNNSSYPFAYYTTYFDLDYPNVQKIIKRLGVTVIGGSNQSFVMKLGFDYTTNYSSYPFQLSSSGTLYYYNTSEAEYTVAEYSGGTQIEDVKAPAGGSGAVVQLGFETEITGTPMSIQRLDVFGKIGKLT